MSKQTSVKEVFQQGVVVFDGAMGTEIYRRNVQTFRSFDELCLTDPDIICEIHVEYCNAGADVLTTNSFGANRVCLGMYGLDDKVEAVNRAAAKLVRDVIASANRPMLAAGSVGPIPRENTFEGDGVAILREQVQSLIDGGVDFIMFETQQSREGIETCARTMEQWPDFPFVLSCTVFSDCESAGGEPLERLFGPLPAGMPHPFAWGMNCGTGPDALLTAVERLIRLVDLPLVVQPNAGIPREVGGRQIYFCSPDYLAGYAKRYLDLGVRGIGGCCGTTPEHIREIAQRIKPLAKSSGKIITVQTAESAQPQEATPFTERSRLAWRLAHRKWVTTVEVVPPRGYDLSDTIAKAKVLYCHGVDAINIPDGPRASSRISPLLTAYRIQSEAQIEAILHFCCRDRNLIGMQADLLACANAGIHNILFVTGDPPKLGNYPFASGVFDMDSIGLCSVQRRLNQGIDLGGQAISPKTNTVIGVGADPTALDQEREIRRFQQKAEAGAEFAITQPVFDTDALLRFLDRIQALNIPVLAGVWPLASFRNAQFLQNEVPGVVIPDGIMTRMEAHSGKEEQRAAGIEIARECVERVRDRIAGVQVSAPFGNVQTALAVIE